MLKTIKQKKYKKYSVLINEMKRTIHFQQISNRPFETPNFDEVSPDLWLIERNRKSKEIKVTLYTSGLQEKQYNMSYIESYKGKSNKKGYKPKKTFKYTTSIQL